MTSVNRGLRARERWFYVLIAPWLIGFLVIQFVPMVMSGFLSLTAWEPPGAPQFVGIDNFTSLAGDHRFQHSAANTAVFAIATVVPGILIGLTVALALGRVTRGRGVLQASVFMPAVVTGAATAVMWGWILNPQVGLINSVLAAFGIDGPAWLFDPAWAMPAIVLMTLWNVGVNVIVFSAALSGVPRELNEAAQLDGAGKLASFRFVIWPALVPVTFYLVVVNTVASFQVFTPTYLLTQGGPGDSTLTMALYTYEAAFRSGDLGYASAVSLVVFAIVVVVTGALFKLAGSRVSYVGAEA